ncbi:MATE family efflux transporter [Mycoplasma iguanae]|uniref:Probable multidrug resistance protein NorM n=1 Tax=Mycoplasma iguanae TaxID=292461 RepID=A0ABY5R840_9MOLU|nr:MATE family efflux transporter [Mycoplasma iguanae]UVD81648.1 MATE family efflux transporter [Mycoplasma iguanae]
MLKTKNTSNNWFTLNFKLTRKEWKTNFFFLLPIILSSILFASNNFVDNFMVTHINGGISALSYANAWMGIIFAFLIGINIVGNMLVGQYKGTDNIKNINSSNRLRYFVSVSFATIFFIGSQISPEWFISFFARTNQGIGYELGIRYIRIVSVTWITTAWIFVSSSICRELGSAKGILIVNIVSVSSNVLFNIIFLNILKMSVEGAAYATLISNFFFVLTTVIIFLTRQKKYFVLPFAFWAVYKEIWIHYFKRIPTMVISTVSFLFIAIRAVFWNQTFHEGSVGEEHWALGAAVVLGITNSINNILTSAFPSVSASVSNFVGKNLGAGNIEEAKKEAQKLRGFNFVFSIGLSVVFSLVFMIILNTNLFAGGVLDDVKTKMMQEGWTESAAINEANTAASFYLKQIQYTLIPIIIFNPFWLWIITTSRAIGSGGRTNLTAVFDFVFNFLHVVFLAMLVYLVVPAIKNSVSNEALLPIILFIFYAFEVVIKIPIYEYLFYHFKWAKKIYK